MKINSFLLLGLVVTASHSAYAQKRLDPNPKIAVHILDRKASGGCNQCENVSLSDTAKYTWKQGGKGDIMLADNNPLVFIVPDVTVTLTETAQHALAAEYAKQLAAFVTAATPAPSNAGGGGADNLPIIVGGLDFKLLLENLARVAGYQKQMRGLINRSLASFSEAAAVKDTVSSWKLESRLTEVADQFDKVNTMFRDCLKPDTKLSTNRDWTYECSDAFKYAIEGREAPKKSTASAAVGTSKAASDLAPKPETVTPPKPGTSSKTETTKVPSKTSNNKRAGATIINTAPPRPPSSDEPGSSFMESDLPFDASQQDDATPSAATDDDRSIFLFLVALRTIESEYAQLSAVLRDFGTDVSQINASRKLTSISYSEQRTTITISVKPATKYEKYFDSDTRKRRDALLSSMNITIDPFSQVTISKSAGVIYLPFAPHYTAEASGAEFTIQNKPDVIKSTTVAAMLNLTPNGWDEPTFGGSFQIGVSPLKDRLGVYIGATINVQQLFSFGAGLSLQQQEYLLPPQAVGQTIATPDLLKTDTRLKPGLYLILTKNERSGAGLPSHQVSRGM